MMGPLGMDAFYSPGQSVSGFLNCETELFGYLEAQVKGCYISLGCVFVCLFVFYQTSTQAEPRQCIFCFRSFV